MRSCKGSALSAHIWLIVALAIILTTTDLGHHHPSSSLSSSFHVQAGLLPPWFKNPFHADHPKDEPEQPPAPQDENQPSQQEQDLGPPPTDVPPYQSRRLGTIIMDPYRVHDAAPGDRWNFQDPEYVPWGPTYATEQRDEAVFWGIEWPNAGRGVSQPIQHPLATGDHGHEHNQDHAVADDSRDNGTSTGSVVADAANDTATEHDQQTPTTEPAPAPTKYLIVDFLFETGISQVRSELEYALYSAHLLNRTLVLPPFVYFRGCVNTMFCARASHEIDYEFAIERGENFETPDDKAEETKRWPIPIEKVYNVERMKEFVGVITLDDWIKVMKRRGVHREPFPSSKAKRADPETITVDDMEEEPSESAAPSASATATKEEEEKKEEEATPSAASAHPSPSPQHSQQPVQKKPPQQHKQQQQQKEDEKYKSGLEWLEKERQFKYFPGLNAKFLRHFPGLPVYEFNIQEFLYAPNRVVLDICEGSYMVPFPDRKPVEGELDRHPIHRFIYGHHETASRSLNLTGKWEIGEAVPGTCIGFKETLEVVQHEVLHFRGGMTQFNQLMLNFGRATARDQFELVSSEWLQPSQEILTAADHLVRNLLIRYTGGRNYVAVHFRLGKEFLTTRIPYRPDLAQYRLGLGTKDPRNVLLRIQGFLFRDKALTKFNLMNLDRWIDGEEGEQQLIQDPERYGTRAQKQRYRQNKELFDLWSQVPLEQNPVVHYTREKFFYLATDEREEKTLSLFKDQGAVLLADLLDKEFVLQHRDMMGFPDWFAYLDQLVATQGRDFLGSPMSLFSGAIINQRIRHHKERRYGNGWLYSPLF